MPAGLGVDTIATARLTGRRVEPGDVGHWISWYTDHRIDEAAWPEHLRTADQVGRIVTDTVAHWDRWGFGRWTVLERGVPVGEAGLMHTRLRGRPEVEVGWFFSPDVWNRGYATEIARESLRVAFEVLELDEVIAFTTPANAPSQAVMRKLGMTFSEEIEHAGLPHLLFTLVRAG